MYVYVAPPTPVGAWSMALGLQQRFEYYYYIPLQAFAKAFNSTPDDLDMHVIYDVSHNIAKFEQHISYSTNEN